MKKIYSLLCALALMTVSSCSDDSDALLNDYVETTQDGSEQFVLKGYDQTAYDVNYFKPKGFTSPVIIQKQQFVGKHSVFMSEGVKKLSEMSARPAEDAAWEEKVTVENGHCYWMRHTTPSEYLFVKMRVAYILGNAVGLEYVNDGSEEHKSNANENNAETGEYVTNLSIPALNASYTYVEHTTNVDGKKTFNMAIEWIPEMQHSNWVAFTFDKTTCQDNVKRTNAWGVDPKLPVDMQVQESQHKSDGFDKGHLCASEDRVYSKEANEQTFYYSNMSPQIADLNQGIWQKMEALVQSWGRSCTNDTYDVVYVTKGGTMNELLKNYDGEGKKGGDGKLPTTDKDGKTIHGLACPKYYYMAILAEKDGGYQAIGLLVEHKVGHPRKPSIEEMQSYVVSIDELEKKTGIDFFCNLNDMQENIVESSYDLSKWAWK